jgi:hypothetical protein
MNTKKKKRVHRELIILPKKKWVRYELRSPLQFDVLDVASSLLNNVRISLGIPDGNIDVSLTKVSKIPYQKGKYSVKAFSFEGVETLRVNSLIRGEFDTIHQAGWTEVQRF